MPREPDIRAALLERLARLDTCAVSDALDACGLAGVATGVHRVSTGRRLAGWARTIRLVPAEGATPGAHLGVQTLSGAGAGQVVVVANGGRRSSAAWGGLLSLAAHRRGVTGVVVDGLARDLDLCASLELPVFALGSTPVTARGRVRESSLDEPVELAGVVVSPRDLVLGDLDGVVFVPQARAAEVIARAESIARFEEQAAVALRNGDPLESVLGPRYEGLLGRAEDVPR